MVELPQVSVRVVPEARWKLRGAQLPGRARGSAHEFVPSDVLHAGAVPLVPQLVAAGGDWEPPSTWINASLREQCQQAEGARQGEQQGKQPWQSAPGCLGCVHAVQAKLRRPRRVSHALLVDAPHDFPRQLILLHNVLQAFGVARKA